MDFRKFILFLVWLLPFVGGSVQSGAISTESLLPRRPLDGWIQVGSPQLYNGKNLFNRVNGQAELFFKYGFQKSVFGLYGNAKNPEQQVEVDIYDMGNVLQAFGLFSRFRSEDRPAGVGLESYVDDTSCLFYQGRYFVMLYGTKVDASILKEMARAISSTVSDPSPRPKEIDSFPKSGLKPGSIEFYPDGLLGYKFLGRGFQATYLEKTDRRDGAEGEEKEVLLFFAIFKNSQGAQDALRAYRETLSKDRKTESVVLDRFGAEGVKGEDPNRGKVVLVKKGFYLAGVVGFDNERSAENLLEGLLRNLR